jgi:hypothetical protein
MHWSWVTSATCTDEGKDSEELQVLVLSLIARERTLSSGIHWRGVGLEKYSSEVLHRD